MECKEDFTLRFANSPLSINRNIVECKDAELLLMGADKKSINRNIVECKAISPLISLAISSVLIETLWNVKH